jgi:glycosyltransferase involved in cell wall biosynthesis
MRIAIFCHKFWPAVSGLCTYTGRLAEYLVERGHVVSVFTTRNPPGAASREQVSATLTVRRFATTLASHPPYHFMPGLLRTAGSHDLREIDVVHTVGYYFFASMFGHWAAGLRRVPHVSTPVYTLNPTTWQRRTFDSVMGRRIVRTAAHVVLQSAHERELLHADRFTLPAHTIVPFGVDSSLFEHTYDTSDLRQRHAISNDERVLLFVGKVMSPKGAFDCLDMMARLRSGGRKVRLIMIGDVHDRESATFPERIRQLDLDRSVILVGPLTDRREIARYYQLSDAVLFPSRYEQFGIVALEAAASGRPLVGTPVGVMQTLVPQYDFGLLHPFGDIDRFASNVASVLDTPRYRDNAAMSRRTVLEKYDWRTISAQTEEIYRSAVKSFRDG